MNNSQITLPETARQRLLVLEANRWVGTLEVGGDNSGQLVELFQKSVDGKAQKEAWCLSFIFYCIDKVDKTFNELFLQSGGHSPLPRGKHVLTLWNNSPQDYRIITPTPGCIMLWQFYKNGKPTTSGHAEIVTQVLADGHLSTIGGNTSDGSGVNRDGDGVYARRRSQNGSTDMKVLGYLKVW
jgi:hypothetical protein